VVVVNSVPIPVVDFCAGIKATLACAVNFLELAGDSYFPQ